MTILGNTRRPDVSAFSNGRIDITARVSALLDLVPGDVIDICVNADGEHLLYVRHKGSSLVGRHEAQLHATKPGKRSRNLRAYSVKLARSLLKASDCRGSAHLPVGAPIDINGTIYLPIITHTIK